MGLVEEELRERLRVQEREMAEQLDKMEVENEDTPTVLSSFDVLLFRNYSERGKNLKIKSFKSLNTWDMLKKRKVLSTLRYKDIR